MNNSKSSHCYLPYSLITVQWYLDLLSCLIVSDDLTGHLLAYISLLPIAILVGFVTLIMFKRELHTVGGSHKRFGAHVNCFCMLQ